MKTLIVVMIFILPLFSQNSKKVEGFESLKWGSSFKEVEKKYSDLFEGTLLSKTDERYPGSKIYTKEYFNKPIKYIYFTLLNNKLVAVSVEYDNSRNSPDSLFKDFTIEYGDNYEATETNKNSKLAISHGYIKTWTSEQSVIKLNFTKLKYNWKMTVDYIYTADFFSKKEYEKYIQNK